MSNENIKLGIMPPLTGLVGIYGSEIVHAAQVACQEINEKGGVLGRPLEIIIEDDGSLPDSAVIAAKKLIDEHHCSAIVGNLLSNSRIAVAYSVAEPRKIPLLNFSFYEGSIISPYFFHFAALPNQQIDKMIPYMRNKFGPRMFFAGNNYEWPRGSIDAGKLALEKVGGEVVGEEYTPIGVEPDVIEELLDHVEAANPDVFVPYFAGADQVLLLTRFTERGLKDKIAVVMGHYDEMMASQLSPEVRDGFYSSNTYFMTIDSEENENYKSRLANLPDVDGIWPEGNGILTNFGEGTYVCVKAFAEAANIAGTLDAEVLIDELDAIRIKAPQGTVHMNPEHHHAKVNTYLSRCDEKGVFNIIENFGAIEPEMPARYRHQKIANQATLEDDIRLQARILEQMTDAVILVSSADGTIVYTNTGAEKLFGYDKDEMIGLSITSLNDPDNNPYETSEEMIKILNQTGEWQGEVRNIKKDDTSIWCSSTVSTFTHPAYGEVWLGVHHEITHIIKTERALRESENQLKEAQRIAKVGGWELDIVANHLKWTDETYDIFEINKEEFDDAYKSFLSRVHPDDVERVEKAFAKSLNNNEPYEIEHRIVMNDGRIKFVLETGETVYSLDNKALYTKGVVQDITERKHTEKELENIFNLSLDMVGTGNLQGYFSKINSSFKRVLGYEEEEFLAKPFIEYVYEGDVEATLAILNEAIEGKTDLYVVNRYKCKDGSLRWIEWNTVADAKENIFYATGRDITERKNAEEEIQRLASIVKHSSDFIGISDIEGQALFLNDAGQEMVGITDEDQFSKLNVLDFFPDSEKARIANKIMPTMMDKDNGRWAGEINFQHFQNGNDIPVWFDFFRIDDPNTGEPINFGTVTQNLTSRKEAQFALKESESLLKAAQHVAHMGYIDWDTITNEVVWSEETYHIFGFPLEFQPTLDSTMALLHPEDAERVGQAMDAAVQKKEGYNIDHRMIRPDGKVIYIHAEGNLTINAHGKVGRMLGTVIDITERKIMDLELEKYREGLEELVEERTKELNDTQDELVRKERLATLGQLTATVSHELRNPLGAMRPSMFIIEKSSDKNDERVQKAIERVDRNIDRCDNIIDELLDFTRITELDLTSVKIDEWLESVIEEQILPEGLQLKIDFSLHDLKLDIDADRVRRAFINIFENACHSMMDGNKNIIERKNACVNISTEEKNNQINIIIEDSGSGMPQEVLEKMFEPLFSTKGFGVGLGMSVVKQIMEQHAGGVEIVSEEGKGTTAKLWFPINIEGRNRGDDNE